MPAAAVIRVVLVLIHVTWRKGCVDGIKKLKLNYKQLSNFYSRVIKTIVGISCIRIKKRLTQERTPKAKAKIEVLLTLRHEGMGSKKD